MDNRKWIPLISMGKYWKEFSSGILFSHYLVKVSLVYPITHQLLSSNSFLKGTQYMTKITNGEKIWKRR